MIWAEGRRIDEIGVLLRTTLVGRLLQGICEWVVMYEELKRSGEGGV
jgi:hypothetical protein